MVESSLTQHATPFREPADEDEKDAFFRMHELERELELLTMQEDILKSEQRQLKTEYNNAKEEVRQTKFG